ncbi:MAG TPA: decaprenyl-phosphate phosphoribosyltransferase [Actinomycetes bacterium]|nr:decaprenyl-phosphate phosphoribosyltransferase [Actinomycetes bacterium]
MADELRLARIDAGGEVRALGAALRPRQWLKNTLVFAAPGAAGVLTRASVALRSVTAFVAFCLVASAIYLVNDLADAAADRLHPTKRLRPLASGLLRPSTALVAAGLLGLAGLGVSAALGPRFLTVVALYVAVMLAYTLRLKHVAVLDIAVVASGFVSRAVAGGVAAGVVVSSWFLITASFASLFVVAGKRYADRLQLGEQGPQVHAVHAVYTSAYLRYVWMTASAVAISAYCVWASESLPARAGLPWSALSVVPFGLAVLRYALLLETGGGSAPEETVLADRGLQALVLVWAVVFACGVYLGR